MINIKSIFSFLFFFIFLFLGTYNADENDLNFKSKLNRCITCHTSTGNSIVGAWPKIAEQHIDYVLKQLFEFKKGKTGGRFDPTMFSMLQEIDEDEMNRLAEYFSKQVLEKGKIKINKNEYNTGKKIYFYGDKENNIPGCVGCHGTDGTGNKLANFPILKWQHKEYLITQMKKFKSGERTNDINEIMRDVVNNMSDEQMNAVATYISSIK